MLGLLVILGIVLLFLLVVIIRTVSFKPAKAEENPAEDISFDKQGAVDSLASLVKCKTVSYNDPNLEDNAEFEKLISLLPKLYPNVFKVCSFEKFPDRGLLFKWQGKSDKQPTVLMAHYDVVPVEENLWEKPPFSAEIIDGVMWGRGTLDTKVTFNAILFAANTLIAENFVPERDVYFAFSGGEEVNGKGAKNIVNYFKENNIELGMVLDEGGAVVEGVFPGVKQPSALIGIAEKGLMNVQYKVSGAGGHASAPPKHTPVGRLSLACAKMEKKPFKAHITKPVAEMFDTLGRNSTFLYRMIFANLWCFGWILDLLAKKTGGEMNALLRTTVAFTQMEGSSAPNVIPPTAKMVSNMRLNPEDTMDSALEYIKKTVADPKVKVNILEGMNPSRISRIDCPQWERVVAAVSETWKGIIVSPYLMVQCSDCRHYGVISDKVYRFSAMDLTAEERKTIHGNNERIRLETLYRAVEFYIRLIKKS